MTRPPARPADLVRLAAGAGVVVYSLGALAAARATGELTTYAAASRLAAALAFGAGLLLVAAGLITSSYRSAWPSGDLALLAALFWFAPFWAGWLGGPASVQTLGTLTAGFAFPLLLHLVLAYPSGRLRSMGARALVAAVYTEAALSAVGRALVRDPFFDPHCWNNCLENVFLVRSDPRIARGIEAVDLWFTVAAGVMLAAICIWRLITASPPARRGLWPALMGGTVLAGATIAHSVWLHRVPIEDAGDRTFQSIFLVGCAAVMLIALGLIWAVFRARIQRRGVARVVAELAEAPAPGFLESALAGAIGDPELRIAYWLPALRRYVDSRGHPVAEPTASRGRAVTSFARYGQLIALVAHRAAELETGAAVRLALENERLRAEVLAQLDDLRDSRARIVETGDAERRRLERDLHDGAQQRLLALSYELRVAGAGANADGELQTASLLADATNEAQDALAELRDIAHGIYPAILGEAGLAPAIATLADSAVLPIEIGETSDERYATPVEAAAYVVIAEGIEDAVRRGANFAAVSAVRDDERLVIEVVDDGSVRASAIVSVADRVGAVGGRVEVAGTMMRAEIPCE